MLTIYGSPKSSAGRCFWCLEELGLEYKNININFQEKEHKGQDFLKINPNGKVPALVDNSFTIWESMAINFYLAEKYSPDFLGEDLEQRSLVRQWSIWSIADLQPPLIEIFIQMVFVPEPRRDLAKIDTAKNKLPVLLRTLDDSLANCSFITGEQFNLADLNLASVVEISESINYPISEFTNITKWLERVKNRPSFKNLQELRK
jgi:glutathione S-transferase